MKINIQDLEQKDIFINYKDKQRQCIREKSALEKSIEVFGNIGKTFGKMFILVIAGIFTVFPFIWMIISALKTKAEVMDVSKLFLQRHSGEIL